MIPKDQISVFLNIYFFELERYLNQFCLEELKKVTFHSDEANTDRPLKESIKNILQTKFNSIPNNLHNKTLELYDQDENLLSSYEYKYYFNFKVSRILLPNEITEGLKIHLRRPNVVYTHPDLLLIVTDGESSYLVPLELKSTKDNSIPGSSVQQIQGDEWVIFVKHTNKSFNVTIGRYLCAVNENMQFPDRSPRPSVSFKTILDWNDEFINNDTESLKIKYPKDLIDKKQELINDWQNVLVNRWLDVIAIPNTKKKVSWFNHTIKKFTINLLERYEKLSHLEQKQLLNKLKTEIEYEKSTD
ncbi:hypothetical protein ACQKNX_20070 [Lysinibacillus sp. NPDC093712]|uniref:hypothetical protein n=1 Tax=Lysinibacillus sp. NPDC093712 TaxID=3390579 RepID=UPI003D05789F